MSGESQTQPVQSERRARSLADYTRPEEITRARIEAMSLAAQTKSISKQQENYSIQKGTLKNLLVLRDSLNQLVEEKNGTAGEQQIRAKQAAPNKEIEDVSQKVDMYAPPNPN